MEREGVGCRFAVVAVAAVAAVAVAVEVVSDAQVDQLARGAAFTRSSSPAAWPNKSSRRSSQTLSSRRAAVKELAMLRRPIHHVGDAAAAAAAAAAAVCVSGAQVVAASELRARNILVDDGSAAHRLEAVEHLTLTDAAAEQAPAPSP